MLARALTLSVGLATMLFAGVASAVALGPIDGDFELQPSGGANAFAAAPGSLPWTFSGTGTGTAGIITDVTATGSGNAGMIVGGGGASSGTIEYTFDGGLYDGVNPRSDHTVSKGSYILRFDLAARLGAAFSDTLTVIVTDSIDGGILFSEVFTAADVTGDGSLTGYERMFDVADATGLGNLVIRFVGSMTGTQRAIVDNVEAVFFVPEPATMGLLGAGALLIGGAARRRRKQA